MREHCSMDTASSFTEYEVGKASLPPYALVIAGTALAYIGLAEHSTGSGGGAEGASPPNPIILKKKPGAGVGAAKPGAGVGAAWSKGVQAGMLGVQKLL